MIRRMARHLKSGDILYDTTGERIGILIADAEPNPTFPDPATSLLIMTEWGVQLAVFEPRWTFLCEPWGKT